MNPYNRLLLYTANEVFLISSYMRTYVTENVDKLSATDGYNIGFAQCHLNVVADMLRTKSIGQSVEDPRLLVQFVSSMKQYPDLINKCIDNYDTHMQELGEETLNKIAKTFISASGEPPSFMLSEAVKKSLLEIDLNLND